MSRAYLPASREEALALRARLNSALGYPRTPVEEDRRGGGVHTPLAEARTLHAVAIEEHPTDKTLALVVLRGVPLARLRTAERAALLTERPEEYKLAVDALLVGAGIE